MEIIGDPSQNYTLAMDLVRTLPTENTTQGRFTEQVLFHAYWQGTLNDKHLFSIQSCWLTNIYQRENRSIILWVNHKVLSTTPESLLNQFRPYSEIRYLNISKEAAPFPLLFDLTTPFSKILLGLSRPRFFSDFIIILIVTGITVCDRGGEYSQCAIDDSIIDRILKSRSILMVMSPC